MTCKDCFHYEACNDFAFGGGIEFSNADKCKHFKDKSLITETPCRVGDTVYLIHDLIPPSNIVECTVEALHITTGKNRRGHRKPSHALLATTSKPVMTTKVYFEDFGKKAFAGNGAKEAAEKALKEGVENET